MHGSIHLFFKIAESDSSPQMQTRKLLLLEYENAKHLIYKF